MDLVTNRTSADVERWRTLHNKGWASMNATEQAEWLAPMRGRYDFTDMNRVESAVKIASERLAELGYVHPRLTVKTNWTREDIPTREDWARYFGNVKTLRDAITTFSTTPSVPSVNDRLNFERANDLEKILMDLDYIATRIPKSWYYAGDIYLGEV